MRITVNGNGPMAQKVVAKMQEMDETQLVNIIDKFSEQSELVKQDFSQVTQIPDVIIDFSHPDTLTGMLAFAVKHEVALVIATTNYSEAQLKQIKAASEHIAIFQSYNTSFGVAILNKVLASVADELFQNYDIEIFEKHHNKKVDSPSGTAKLLAKTLSDNIEDEKIEHVYDRSTKTTPRTKNEIGISAIRGGTIFGEHSVFFCGDDEVLEFKHTALSKNVFVLGAIKAAILVANKDCGLYNLDTLYK